MTTITCEKEGCKRKIKYQTVQQRTGQIEAVYMAADGFISRGVGFKMDGKNLCPPCFKESEKQVQ